MNIPSDKDVLGRENTRVARRSTEPTLAWET